METNMQEGGANLETQSFSAIEFQNFTRMMAQFNAMQAMQVQSFSSVSPLQDPFYLHLNEALGILLIDLLLTNSNYYLWSRSVKISLKSKNKLKFIDGILIKPEDDNPLFGAWDRCNNFILSCLHRSLNSEILQSVLWCDNTHELWKYLKHRFYQ
ncbi:uncharacterized protein DS421_13g437430 [Arachis hypogaea]|nr:uncharacterized protein DS421_13g437430 [Arachis hypogaea]